MTIDRIFIRKAVQSGNDEEVWRSTEEGKHFKIETETGEIKAGFGGKLNGQKIKSRKDPERRKSSGTQYNEAQKKAYNTVRDYIKKSGQIPTVWSGRGLQEGINQAIYGAISAYGELDSDDAKGIYEEIQYFPDTGRIYWEGASEDVTGCTKAEIDGAKKVLATAAAKKGRKPHRRNDDEKPIQVDGPKETKAFIKNYFSEHPEVEKEVPKYKGVLDKVKNFYKTHKATGEDDGSYSITTGEKMELKDGYNLTFHQNASLKDPYRDYTDDDYAAMCAIAKNELKSNDVYIGWFGGNAEVSFNCRDPLKAMEFARKHNQHSIWDNFEGRGKENKYWNPETNPCDLG